MSSLGEIICPGLSYYICQMELFQLWLSRRQQVLEDESPLDAIDSWTESSNPDLSCVQIPHLYLLMECSLPQVHRPLSSYQDPVHAQLTEMALTLQ